VPACTHKHAHQNTIPQVCLFALVVWQNIKPLTKYSIALLPSLLRSFQNENCITSPQGPSLIRRPLLGLRPERPFSSPCLCMCCILHRYPNPVHKCVLLLTHPALQGIQHTSPEPERVLVQQQCQQMHVTTILGFLITPQIDKSSTKWPGFQLHLTYERAGYHSKN
jgi:hypothetical protein